MIKTNLPVMLLRGIVLLPYNEIRLEFDNNTNKDVIEVAELFHDSRLLIVCQENHLEEEPSIDDLPKVGVICEITHKMELPNNKTRVIIIAKERALVHEYLNMNNSSHVLESIASTAPKDEIDEKSEEILIRKLNLELGKYIDSVSNVGNSFVSTIKSEKSLEKYTDLVVPFLPLSLNEKFKFLITVSSVKRAEMLLEVIYKESEIYQIERSLDAKVHKNIDNSQKEYILREKIKTIKEELGEISPKDDDTINLQERVEKLKAPKKIKERLNKELKRYELLNSMSPELSIIRSYIECMLDLPWENETKDNSNFKNVKKVLDESHAGLKKIKERIIEYLAVLKVTKKNSGEVICLVGPPGVGKTSLASSIAKAMKRNFVKLSVGGFNDPAEILGHRRSYMGAEPGRIIQSMKRAGSSNPVFLIDEIDKMTKDIKGDPASSLLEVLDPEQNSKFSDHYIEEEFDLSKVMFIATANYIEQIPYELRDRLELIELSSYTEYEKLDIAKNYLIPRQLEEHGLTELQVSFEDEAILTIIRNYTKEAGVRELERLIASLLRKIVKKLLTEFDVAQYNITNDLLEEFLGKKKYQYLEKQTKKQVGVVNGMAYTVFGGDILPIEVTYYKGNGKLILTGSLGEVMQESAHIALSYIKANAKEFGIDFKLFEENDLHIHLPEGAVNKEGPSAGIALATSLISVLSNKAVSGDISMTGELTLQGRVLPIGGLKEKVLGASRAGIKKIFLPKQNEPDLDEIPEEIKSNLKFVLVSNYIDVYKEVFGVK